MTLQQRLRASFLNFLKYYFNPLTRRIARTRFGPFAIIRHVGRRSGKTYETPIIVQPTPTGFIIELTYGPEVDWYKNVRAADGCTVVWHGRDYLIRHVQPLEAHIGRAAFPLPIRLFLRVTQRNDYAALLLENSALI